MRVYLSHHEEHHALGAVHAAVESVHVGRGQLAQPIGPAQYGASQRVLPEDDRLEVIIDELRWLVVVTLYLLYHHLGFLHHLVLWEGAVQHHVGE